MKKFDYTDAIGGALFCLLGVSVALYARSQYELGSLEEMGPGLFPFYLGIIIALMGAGIVGTTVRQHARERSWNLRPMVYVTLGMIAFALMIERFGALVSIFSLVALSTWPESTLSPIKKAVLFSALVLVAYVIFKFALSMNFSLIKGVW